MSNLSLRNTISKHKYYLLIILYLILALFLIYKIIDTADYLSIINKNNRNKKISLLEGFSSNITNTEIRSFILEPIIKIDTKLADQFYGTSLCNKGKCNYNLLKTQSLESDNWVLDQEYLQMLASLPSSDGNKLPYSLCYNKDNNNDGQINLLINMAEYDSNKNKIFNIYKLDRIGDDLNKLYPVTNFQHQNKLSIMSLLFDKDTSTWLGINYFDGQIYENKQPINKWLKDKTNKYWEGPIKFEKPPMQKIMYDKDGYLIGIGNDGYMYRKTQTKWRNKNTIWDLNKINKTKVHDLIYDYDGCLIATTPNGIFKQNNPEFNSNFVDIRGYKQKHNNILNKLDILLYKSGIDFFDELFNIETNFGVNLKTIYDFKKKSKDLCLSRTRNRDTYDDKEGKIQPDDIGFQNRKISDLYGNIDAIYKKMEAVE